VDDQGQAVRALAHCHGAEVRVHCHGAGVRGCGPHVRTSALPHRGNVSAQGQSIADSHVRSTRNRTPGFTILEALAAVVTLGLLAAAVVPLLRNLGQLTSSERLLAPVPGHPGWRLNVSELTAEPEPPPPPGSLPPAAPPHHWLLVGIEAEASGERLAETVVAVLDRP
jgi:hypothetical protein